MTMGQPLCETSFIRSGATNGLIGNGWDGVEMMLPVLLLHAESSTIGGGRGCGPVAAPVFKIGGRRRRAGVGGFDSHAFPPEIPATKRFVS